MNIPFTQSDSVSSSTRLSGERLINAYLRPQENSVYPYALFGTPGTSSYLSLGSEIRGILKRNSDVYVVAGTSVYKNGALLAGDAISGTGMVSMAANSTQVVIVAGNGYVVTATVAQITDPDWRTADTVTYLNGVFVFNARDTGEAFSSAIEDATNLDALDFATAESAPDNLVGVYSEGDRLVMAGTETTEFWYYDGGPQFPFSRIPGSTVQVGIKSPHGVTFIDNTFFFLGDDVGCYRMGQVPQRQDTPSIADRIRGYTNTENAIVSSYTRNGHVFIIFHFDQGTHVYDVYSRKWHERISYKKANWRYRFVYQAGATVYAGDEDGNVVTLEEDVYDENGAILPCEFITPEIINNQEWMYFKKLQLIAEMGVGLTTGQGSDPQIMMQYSDNGGKNWSSELWRSLGPIGEYNYRALWNRLGRSRGRRFRFKITDPVKRAFIGLMANG